MTVTLVDPLDGLALPPGDPGVLREGARSYERASRAMAESADRQHRALSAVTGKTWKGAAAENAKAAVEKVISAYRNASGLAEVAVGVLNSCASEWDDAQAKWWTARHLADEAVATEQASAHAAAGFSLFTLDPDYYASPDRRRARQMAEEAIDDFDQATRLATGKLDDLTAEMLSTPAFLPKRHIPWYDKPIQWSSDAVDALGGPRQIAKDVLDTLGIVASADLTVEGGAAIGGGLVLSTTGVGVLAGAPLAVAGVAAAGVGLAGADHFGHQLTKDLSTHHASADAGSGTEGSQLAGTGRAPGVLEASPDAKSVAAINAWSGSPTEFVFDPDTGTFAMGRPAESLGLKGSPHQQLAQVIGANPDSVVGGIVSRGSDGSLQWDEMSGHYYQNWTESVRQQFVRTMDGYGVNIGDG